ncbi:hypothetical protein KVMX100_20054 [Klebsiella variicola]|nr:hypothetical protein KVMX100_20054 [Klebsiella variicola]
MPDLGALLKAGVVYFRDEAGRGERPGR